MINFTDAADYHGIFNFFLGGTDAGKTWVWSLVGKISLDEVSLETYDDVIGEIVLTSESSALDPIYEYFVTLAYDPDA